MIPEATIRLEKFDGARESLRESLRDIPMTADKRDEIDYAINVMVRLFNEVN